MPVEALVAGVCYLHFSILVNKLLHYPQMIGVHLVVGVEKINVPAASLLGPVVAGRTTLAVLLVKVAYPRVSYPGHHFACVIAATIVDQNQLKVLVFLLQDG